MSPPPGPLSGWPARMRRPHVLLTDGFRARHTRWWALLGAEMPAGTTLQVRLVDPRHLSRHRPEDDHQ